MRAAKHRKHLGKLRWVVPGGHIPLTSNGPEPAFTSRDQLAVLNTSETDAEIRLTVFFTKGKEVGPFTVKVSAQRLRKIRFNDLIDPQALPLGKAFACMLESNVPVVVQFIRVDTGQAALAYAGGVAFPQQDSLT